MLEFKAPAFSPGRNRNAEIPAQTPPTTPKDQRDLKEKSRKNPSPESRVLADPVIMKNQEEYKKHFA
jgi:hypothetical protein